jgi:hypothetical protein
MDARNQDCVSAARNIATTQRNAPREITRKESVPPDDAYTA